MNKKAEAIKRLKMLKILPAVVEEFEEKGIVELSERINGAFPAALYWVTNETYNNDNVSLVKAIKDFEEKFDALVYHVQLSHATFGDVYSFFYVSDCPDEWEADKAMLKDGYAYCYVYNATYPDLSEIGSIGFRSVMGGVERTA